jgi:hypothetical protein
VLANCCRKAHLITNDRLVGIAVLRMTEVKVRNSLKGARWCIKYNLENIFQYLKQRENTDRPLTLANAKMCKES